MKILKVKVEKRRTKLRCQYLYPENWNALRVDVLAYENHPENLGTRYEDCLFVTDDATAAKLLTSSRIREISKEEANEFGKVWRPSRVFIDDEYRIVKILQKLRNNPSISEILKKHLGKRDLDSIDPDKPEIGIQRKPEFNIDNFLK